ncbi:MAG: 7,8-dihydropterin-6-yl-methyl-4-(beta-D-ribofuranosyl)aminobenzene 5'-phosphate synthase [Candidatus Krumholzibacteriia bacterium]|jgi:7,8-dihydropterin-6-yl-methyl-4-(beta-D-ribofuranosyl)aminobenzene 5'-phosphate synthase
MKKIFLAIIVISAYLAPTSGLAQDSARATELKVTTLSTMLTEFRGVGEWGYSALIEVDGKTILFDTGARPKTVLRNAEELGIDLSIVETVIVSHHHWDHTGGLVTLRKTLQEANPMFLQQAHVGKGIFLPRSIDPDAVARMSQGGPPKELIVKILDVRHKYEALGGKFIVHDGPYELQPGVWVTGPIPRVHDERNWTPFNRIEQDGSFAEDTIPEDQALIIDTDEGLVVVAGCGHAGIVNTMEYARKITGNTSILAVIGGFHMLNLTEEKVTWTGAKMREFGVQHVVGAHCTGINAVTGVRKAAHLDRGTAVVGAVGTAFTVGLGIEAGFLTR